MEALQRGFQNVYEQLGIWGPRIALGIVLVLAGWVVAKILQRWTGAIAERTGLDRPFTQMAEDAEMPTIPESGRPSRILGVLVFWVVMLLVVVGFLTSMRLDPVAQPLTTLLSRIATWLPNLLGALVLVVAGWLIATVLRTLVVRMLQRSGLDAALARMGIQSEEAAKQERFAAIVGVIAYGLVLLLFIPTALDIIGLRFVAETVQRSLDSLAASVPGILAAVMVLGIAALIAYLARPPISRLLASTGVDQWGRTVGLTPEGGVTISTVVGHFVFWLILLFAFPAALDKLGLEPIVTPLRNAWDRTIQVLPNALAALGIAIGAWLLGRVCGPIAEKIFSGIGLDSLLGRMGLARWQDAASGRWQPSKLLASVAVFLIYMVLAQEALHTLGMTYMADLVARIVSYLPNLFVAVVIFAIALYLGSLLGQFVRQATSALSDVNSELAAAAANVAVVVFGAAMALSQLQVGGRLVEQTVLLIIGAVCLAAAIAFGLGSRAVVENWMAGRFGKSG